MSTVVKYNGATISPTPFVGKTMEAVDYGNRWGYVQNITIQGVMTGAAGTGKINSATDLFQQGFKTLTVESAGDPSYYEAENCVLESLSFGANPFYNPSEIAVPYTVNLKSYTVPSGVIDIKNSYSFKENANGIVSVNREISAKGVKAGSADPIDNAYNFVALFTGKDPVSTAAPFLVSGASQSILISSNENVDRLNGSFSVSEVWQYETGSNNAYTTIASLSIEEDVEQEFLSLSLNVDFRGNVVNNNFSTVRDAARDFSPYNKLTEYGVATGEILINNFSIKENEKENSVNYSMSFLSGESSQALSGLMFHDIGLEWDEIKNEKNFTINSTFKINGPQEYRNTKILEKKDEILGDYDHYIAYLYHTIKESELYNQFETLMGDGHELNPNPTNFSIKEDTTKKDFSLSAQFNDKDYKANKTKLLPNGKSYPVSIGTSSYSVAVTPESWIFELEGAANVEGHFVVQDIQCKNREKLSLNFSNEDLGVGLGDGTDLSRFESFTGASGVVSNIITALSGTNTSNRFYLVDNTHNSGDFSNNISKNYILKTGLIEEFGKNKFSGFLGHGYGRRVNGFKFGF